MTTSPERSGAAPWYCSHESSRAATSTMVAAGLVATAALMACVGLLVAGDEVSALVAAMVMLVAGANTWSAGRSRSWWQADPTPVPEARPRPAPVAPPRPHLQAAAPVVDAQGYVRQDPRPAELRGVPGAAGASRSVPAPDAQGHVRQGPRPAERPGVPLAGAPQPEPRVVRLAAVTATPPRAPRGVESTTVSHDDGPDDERTASSRASHTAPASAAARPRRRTAPARPVSRRVAGTRPS